MLHCDHHNKLCCTMIIINHHAVVGIIAIIISWILGINVRKTKQTESTRGVFQQSV